MAELLTEYCVCGGEMEGVVAPNEPSVTLKTIFWSLHMGKGHAKVTRPEMLAGRNIEDRDPSMFEGNE